MDINERMIFFKTGLLNIYVLFVFRKYKTNIHTRHFHINYNLICLYNYRGPIAKLECAFQTYVSKILPIQVSAITVMLDG